MNGVSEDFWDAVSELLTVLRCNSVAFLQNKQEHVVCDEMVGVWEFLLKYCRPSCEICEIQKVLTRMNERQELRNYRKKVHLRKIVARKKKLNSKCERTILQLVTKHCHADCDILDTRKSICEMENKVFLLHCKVLEVERELKLLAENCDLISRYISDQEDGSLSSGLSPSSCAHGALGRSKAARRGESGPTGGRHESVGDDGLRGSAGKTPARGTDAAGVWEAVLCLLDQARQQVEQMSDGHSEAGMSNSCGLSTLANFRLQFVELAKNVTSLESDMSASKNDIIINTTSEKLLKDWFLMQHLGDTVLFGSAVEDFVKLSVNHQHLKSIKNHYLSIQETCSDETYKLMTLEVEKLIRQREDMLHKNAECQSRLRDALAHCSGLLLDIGRLAGTSSRELSEHLSAGRDWAGTGRLAEEASALWARELDMFLTFPLCALPGICLRSKQLSPPQLVCPETLRTCVPALRPSDKLVTLHRSMFLLPAEAALIKLANTVVFRAARKEENRAVAQLASLPIINVSQLKVEKEILLSTYSSKLKSVCQSFEALVHSFEENEKNLLFWASQPLSPVAKTMVVNGRTFEDFQQVRNMSSLCKSSSVQSGLNNLKSFQSFRKRTDSM
ncbi:uncharacterized protein LOC134542191 [Bacillus rossius redtenbacheri]|uniref:uncharacterized protein LOC134542191 n=1 Tax=Bacillus rossius redtenbacheri TaxID=93214 RepID=UPI002FDD8707